MTHTPMLSAESSRRLVHWYRSNHRHLPWRETNDPYRIWVSEVMLQQTQTGTVIPYFERFLAEFPTLRQLADADIDKVLKLWEGLGYYRRARNLHHAAKQLAAHHGGTLPRSYRELLNVPGIGTYTAAAIASIAYGQKEPVVDGNVLRVIARYRGITGDIRGHATVARIRDGLRCAIASAPASDFNQGLMELGAVVCTPRDPVCADCPFSQDCFARRHGRTAELPHRKTHTQKPHYHVGLGVIWKNNRMLIAKRRHDQMLGGMWELPGGKRRGREALHRTVTREVREEVNLVVTPTHKYGSVKHAYSHFGVTLHAFHCMIESGTPAPLASDGLAWITPAQVKDYAFPRGTQKVFELISTTPGRKP